MAIGRNTLLTDEASKIICDAIRSGAFDYVAAQAAGIGRTAFYDWLRRGENGEEPFAQFSNNVAEARAAARQGAEHKVYLEQPFNWLRYGPGRERPGEPGWTDERTVNLQTGDAPIKLTWAGDDGETDAED